MNTLTLKLYVGDYEGNSQYYNVTINLDTWETEYKKQDEKVCYSPGVEVQSVEITMDEEVLKRDLWRDDDGKFHLDTSNYNLS